METELEDWDWSMMASGTEDNEGGSSTGGGGRSHPLTPESGKHEEERAACDQSNDHTHSLLTKAPATRRHEQQCDLQRVRSIATLEASSNVVPIV